LVNPFKSDVALRRPTALDDAIMLARAMSNGCNSTRQTHRKGATRARTSNCRPPPRPSARQGPTPLLPPHQDQASRRPWPRRSYDAVSHRRRWHNTAQRSCATNMMRSSSWATDARSCSSWRSLIRTTRRWMKKSSAWRSSSWGTRLIFLYMPSPGCTHAATRP
jgi:hypothetical protein